MNVSIAALDLSLTATGVALPNGTLATWKPTVAGDARLLELQDHLVELIRSSPIDLVVVEDFVVRTPAAASLGMVHGAMRTVLMRHNVIYTVASPASLKKYATGKGNSPKPDVRMALYKRTGVDEPDDNRVDAAWLRLMAIDRYTGEACVPLAQRAALGAVHWPELLKGAA